MATTTSSQISRDTEADAILGTSLDLLRLDATPSARTESDTPELLPEGDCRHHAFSEFAVDMSPHHSMTSDTSTLTRILRTTGLLDVAWWLPEVAASILSLTCLASIVMVSLANDGRPVTLLKLPTSLTLNATLSILSTLSRSLLLVPVSSAIMQDLWIWYTQRKGGKDCTSKFSHLDIANDASRGPFGSSKLLIYYHGRRPWAYLGAVVTIASIFFGPSVQQLINYDHHVPVPGVHLPNIAWSRHATVVRDDMNYASYQTSNAFRTIVSAALLTNQLQSVPGQDCSTADCRWPRTPTIAVCSECNDLPKEKPTSHQGSTSYFPIAPMNETVGLDAAWDDEHNSMSFISGTIFIMKAVSGNPDSEETTKAFPILTFYALGAPYTNSSNSIVNLTDMIAYQCELRFCVQTFFQTSSSDVAGDERLVNSFDYEVEPQHFIYNSTSGLGKFKLDHNPSEEFSFGSRDWSDIASYLYTQLNGSHIIGQSSDGSQSMHTFTMDEGGDYIGNIRKASSNPRTFARNLAGSITTYFRTSNSSDDELLDGVAYEFGVTVRWGWLALPVALTLLSVCLLIATIVESRRKGITPWKSSLLRVVLFEPEDAVIKACEGHMNDYNGVEDAVGDRRVRLVEQTGQRWRFVAA